MKLPHYDETKKRAHDSQIVRKSPLARKESNLFINPLYLSIFANSEDPDEMLHNASFHQVLRCLSR